MLSPSEAAVQSRQDWLCCGAVRTHTLLSRLPALHVRGPHWVLHVRIPPRYPPIRLSSVACCVCAPAVPITGQVAGFLSRHGFRSGEDVFRDLPPPFCLVFLGKYGCGLHRSVPSCRPLGCNVAELGASALDPPHQMSGGRRYGWVPRERDAEKCWAEHGSGASCAEATGCGTWVEATGKT